MLSSYGEAQGDYDDALKKLLHQSRAEAGPAQAVFHSRILWCQVDADDLAEFRNRVLVPAMTEALADPQAPPTMVEDLATLVAMVPDPAATADPKIQADWKAMLAAIGKANDKVQRAFTGRRASARRERANPPPMIKKVNFCGAAESAIGIPKMD